MLMLIIKSHISFVALVNIPQRFFEQVTAITTTMTNTIIMRVTATATPPRIAAVLFNSEVAVAGKVMLVVPAKKTFTFVWMG